ncbi:LamG-like jellyroll fold domain-containing protein [Ferruginivarius sediminum]|uniref:Uncharacterized protein n=1 Tax=Ferruginivarius sediminum TaxID=2661937 RepID=A0A369TBG6_9PROT|nr:LamG-like jellyroll fold domain-containing protein [Ferruginivarius sediminum]RDD62620.1 hypothetical protein DRB17_05515 [Ferruginivarius sediminum]
MATRRKLISGGTGSGTGLEATIAGIGSGSRATLAFWVRRTGNATLDTIWASDTGADQLYTSSGDTGVDFIYRIGGDNSETTAEPMQTNTWVHVTLQFGVNAGTSYFDASTTDSALWVNGTKAFELNGSGTLEVESSGTHWLLQDDGADGGFPGEMFDVVFVDDIYDPSELNYSAADGGSWKDLDAGVGFSTFGYRIDGQDTGTVGADSSGNNNDFAQSTGGSDVTLSDTDLPAGANPATGTTVVMTGAGATSSVASVNIEVGQYLRPSQDGNAGNWSPSTGSDLYAMLDEANPDDGDYIESSNLPANEVTQIKLGAAADPGVNTGHVIRYRYEKTGSAQIDLTVRLTQGQGGTTVATWSHTNIPTSWTGAEQTLTTGEADSITDYADLWLEFEANAP